MNPVYKIMAKSRVLISPVMLVWRKHVKEKEEEKKRNWKRKIRGKKREARGGDRKQWLIFESMITGWHLRQGKR